MNWRFTASYLAIQTTLTALSPLALGQEPQEPGRQVMVATAPLGLQKSWHEQLDDIVSQQVTLSDARSGVPVKMSDAFGDQPTFPAKTLIRPVHDRYLPSAFSYVLESHGNYQFQINVHKTNASGNPEEGFFTTTPLDLTPPMKDDSMMNPGQWFRERLADQFVFFRKIRKMAILHMNSEKINKLPDHKSDLDVYVGVFVVSLFAIAGAMVWEAASSSRLTRSALWLPVILGTALMTFSGAVLGLNQRFSIDQKLKQIDEVFQVRFSNASDQKVQEVLETQLDDLLIVTQNRLSTPPVNTPAEAYDCAKFIMGVLTLVLLTTISKVGIRNPMLKGAAVLGIGTVSYMLGSIINSTGVGGLSPDALPRSIDLESEALFRAMK